MAYATKKSNAEHSRTSTPPSDIPVRFMHVSEVCKTTGQSVPTVYRKVAAGTFPAPVKLGRSSRWVASEVLGWCADRITERNGEVA